MNNLCNGCNLRDNIELKREELNELIQRKDKRLLDESIIEKSQALDAMVFQCTFCYKNLNRISQIKLEKLFDAYSSSFYYYGEYHLFSTIYFYILEAGRNREMVSIFMEDKLFIKLLEYLRNNNAPLKHVKYNNIIGLIKNNQYRGLDIIKEEINNTLVEKGRSQYKAIRWIGQPSSTNVQSTRKEYKDFEAYIANTLKNRKVSLLNIYDAYEFMNKTRKFNGAVAI